MSLKAAATLLVMATALALSVIFAQSWLEGITGWLNIYDDKNGHLLDAVRVFVMLGLANVSSQLFVLVVRHNYPKALYFILIPFPPAFMYFFLQVFTHNSEVLPRNGIIITNVLNGLILLGYSAVIGMLREANDDG